MSRNVGRAAVYSLLLGPVGGLYVTWWFAITWAAIFYIALTAWGTWMWFPLILIQSYSAIGTCKSINNQNRER